MLFVITATDKPDSQALRTATREAHLAYLDGLAGIIHLAGPLLNETGESIGSLLVVDLPDAKAAVDFTVADPYRLAHLFANVTIEAFRAVYKDGARL
jgi:uncharacterized protein YciI